MSTIGDYEQRVDQIVGAIAPKGTLRLTWDTVVEAKAHKSTLVNVQKELRLVKKEIGLLKKATISSYTAEKEKVGKGFGAGFAAGLFGKKAVGSNNASMKENLRERQAKAIRPFELLSHRIDGLLLQIDQTKIQIDAWLVGNKAS